MAFEEYQFLRYFIPGSLYVIYTTLIALPNLSNDVIKYVSERPDSLIGIVGAAFASSLVFGYIIYSTYDWLLYNKLAVRQKWRKSLTLVKNSIEKERKEIWVSLSKEKKKEFLDMLYIGLGDADKNQQASSTIRGIWSHFNARIVSSVFVPIFSVVSILLLYACADSKLFSWSSSATTNGIVTICIFAVSVSLLVGAIRPYREAVILEFFFLKNKINVHNKEFKEIVSSLIEKEEQ